MSAVLRPIQNSHQLDNHNMVFPLTDYLIIISYLTGLRARFFIFQLYKLKIYFQISED
jgi:hypothetical protein